jgi:hypothetical protein
MIGQKKKKRAARIRLDRSSNGMLMTPEEFDAVTDCDDRFVYELIHGVVIVVPPPGEAERDPNEELGFLLRLYQHSHPQGSILDKTLAETGRRQRAIANARKTQNNQLDSRLPITMYNLDSLGNMGVTLLNRRLLGLLAAISPDYNGTRFALTPKRDKTLRRFCRR